MTRHHTSADSYKPSFLLYLTDTLEKYCLVSKDWRYTKLLTIYMFSTKAGCDWALVSLKGIQFGYTSLDKLIQLEVVIGCY